MNVDEEVCWKGGRRGYLLLEKQVSKRIMRRRRRRLDWVGVDYSSDLSYRVREKIRVTNPLKDWKVPRIGNRG